jgi:hypothetical protein
MGYGWLLEYLCPTLTSCYVISCGEIKVSPSLGDKANPSKARQEDLQWLIINIDSDFQKNIVEMETVDTATNLVTNAGPARISSSPASVQYQHWMISHSCSGQKLYYGPRRQYLIIRV